MKKEIIREIFTLITCLVVMMVATVQTKGMLFKNKVRETVSHQQTVSQVANDTIHTLSDGTIVINTTYLSKDINGFGGNVPLKIFSV